MPGGEHHVLGALLAPVLAAVVDLPRHVGTEGPRRLCSKPGCVVSFITAVLRSWSHGCQFSIARWGFGGNFILPLCVISPGFVKRRKSTANLDWVVLSPGKDVLGPGWEEEISSEIGQKKGPLSSPAPRSSLPLPAPCLNTPWVPSGLAHTCLRAEPHDISHPSLPNSSGH